MSQQLRRRELIGGLGVAWLLALVPNADTEGMRVAGEEFNSTTALAGK